MCLVHEGVLARPAKVPSQPTPPPLPTIPCQPPERIMVDQLLMVRASLGVMRVIRGMVVAV